MSLAFNLPPWLYGQSHTLQEALQRLRSASKDGSIPSTLVDNDDQENIDVASDLHGKAMLNELHRWRDECQALEQVCAKVLIVAVHRT